MQAIMAHPERQPRPRSGVRGLLRDLKIKVMENEPGAKLYQLVRCQNAPASYRAMEFYTDMGAVEAQSRSTHFVSAGPGFAELLAEPLKVEIFDAIDGDAEG